MTTLLSQGDLLDTHEQRCPGKTLIKTKKNVHLVERHLICCLFDHIVVHSLTGTHSCRHLRALLAPLLPKTRSLHSSSVWVSTCPRLPRDVWINQVRFLGFSVFLLSQSPWYHDTPRTDIIKMRRSTVAPLQTKALCAVYHEIGAYAAACTTAESETKECCKIGEGLQGPPSCLVFVFCPVRARKLEKTMLLRNCARRFPLLPHRRLEVCLLLVSQPKCGSIQNNGPNCSFYFSLRSWR